MSNTNSKASSSSEIINVLRSATTNDDCGTIPSTTRGASAAAANFSKLLLQEIDFVEESFEAVKHKVFQAIAEINDARKSFEKLMLLLPPGGTQGGIDPQLQHLKKKVSKLKFSIPFNLIVPSDQPNPNIINRRPRYKAVNEIRSSLDVDDYDIPVFPRPPPTYHELESHVRSLDDMQKHCLACVLIFPENTIIKKSILFNFVNTHSFHTPLSEFSRVMDEISRCGLIESIYKKPNLTVAGYRMHPFVHSTLHVNKGGHKDTWYLGHGDEEDIFYGEEPAKFKPEKHLEIVYLGKWKRSATQHIEVTDPDFFFRDTPKLKDAKFVSLRGISLIEELPTFITNLGSLSVLDLNACHNLEVIPSTIANLQGSLTHLDMSKCYFLDHMPKALATLHKLEVLKGFFVGDSTTKQESCTVEDLVNMRFLRKLNIYTSMKEFPNKSQLTTLQALEHLSSLTISWGGSPTLNGLTHKSTNPSVTKSTLPGHETISLNVRKLDLQCVPESVTLVPVNFKYLKKLYIRGGKFCDLGQLTQGSHWNVQILRLMYLSKLKNLDTDEFCRLFPKLICFENVKCPNLDRLPHVENGVWTNSAQSNPTT